MIRRVGFSPSSATATTFWLARSGVSRRPGEAPVSPSASTESRAAPSIAAPTVGWLTERRLPASASATCQACASAQFGRHQNDSVLTLWPARNSSWASRRAARRSASVPGPRRSKAASIAVVSSGRIGADDRSLDPIETFGVSPDEERQLLAVARDAAEAGAAELRQRFGGRASGVRSKSTPTDLVSDADLAAESAI